MKKTVLFFVLCVGLCAQTYVLTTGEWEPYISENMVAYGPVGAVVKEACKRADVVCEFDFMPWKRSWAVALGGRAAGTFLWSADGERDTQLLRSDVPIGENQTVFFYMSDSNPEGFDVKSFADLKGKSVVGVRGYYGTKKAEEARAKVHKVNNSEIALNFLAAGKADIYIDGNSVVMLEAQKFIPQKVGLLKKGPTTLEVTKMYIYYTRTDKSGIELKEKLDKVLKNMESDRTIAKIYAEYNKNN